MSCISTTESSGIGPVFSIVIYVRFDVDWDVFFTWIYKPPYFGRGGLASDKVEPSRPVFLLEQFDFSGFVIRRHLDVVMMVYGW